MRVRHIITQNKFQDSDTGWSLSDMPPRFSPIYTKSRPIKAGWKWRSSFCHSDETKFILTALCNARRDNWQSYLMVETTDGASVVGRFESHGSHPGVHGHAHCERGGIEVGAGGLDNLVRCPPANAVHRRTNAWTENTFWEAARSFFRVIENFGPLFNDAT
jgi:hypothetical protein